MSILTDTIAAIITPPGEGGIAAIRIAGPRANQIALPHFRSAINADIKLVPFHMTFCHFISSEKQLIDEVMVVSMPEGHSYTGESQIEIFCHGGRTVVQMILRALLDSGARAAEPGEFTRLAFLNGKIDLVKAEAIAEIISANSTHSYEVSREHLLGAYASTITRIRGQLISVLTELESSIDFSEETGYSHSREQLRALLLSAQLELTHLIGTYNSGRVLREGYKIALAGRPNAGKSSLFNVLLQQSRALVTPTPGTTRDFLSEWIELGGIAVNLIDTAGLRQDGDHIEKLGQERAKEIIAGANLVIWLFDASSASWQLDLEHDLQSLDRKKTLLIANKSDLMSSAATQMIAKHTTHAISCLTQSGIAELKTALEWKMNEQLPDLTSGLVVTSSRHQQKLSTALSSVEKTLAEIESQSPEFLVLEMRLATSALDEITGRVYTEEILGEIFSKFCIGK